MPAKPMPAISPAPTPSTRPTISSRPPRKAPRARCASGAAGFSATAPAPARAARSPRSFSTTGSRAGAGALWISKSDKLIEDAERDWTAIGGYRSDIVPLSRFRQGAAIALDEGHPLYDLRDLAHPGARARRPAAFSRSSTGSAVNSTASSCSTKRTRWPTPPATRANAAKRNPRSRARPGCACRTHCTMRASSTSRRPAPRRCRTSPMRHGSACGAPVIFRSRRAPILSRRWKAAASPRWRCWPAI